MRGSRPQHQADRCILGSIPACAGKPSAQSCRNAWRRVYPRVCGEAQDRLSLVVPIEGLSPRVRGSLGQSGMFDQDTGSIPACAGKPCEPHRGVRAMRVYPRVCGEADSEGYPHAPWSGLSPRVRGSPFILHGSQEEKGSIPACAGKPGAWSRVSRHLRVYPRVCGEATPSIGGRPMATGLSPRVRGSRCRTELSRYVFGSIPACAGKPIHPSWIAGGERVYPRVCGEARSDAVTSGIPSSPGLSPRVRGSHTLASLRSTHGDGSIPACAGKPMPHGTIPICIRVYPRVCGEAMIVDTITSAGQGLSPRVRGSRRRRNARDDMVGSIPACAGKPYRGSGIGSS